MNIDIRTIALLIVVANLLQALVFVIQRRAAPRYQGIGFWAASYAFSAAAHLVTRYCNMQTDHFAIVVGFSSMICAFVMLYLGVVRFLDVRRSDRYPAAFLLVYIIALTVVTYSEFGMNARIFLLGTCEAIVFGICARDISARAGREYRTTSWFTASLFALLAVVVALRMILLPFGQPVDDIFASSSGQVFAFLGAFVGGFLIMMGLVMMINERLHSELSALATTDLLTGTRNRRAGREIMEAELARVLRGAPPFSILLFDLDHFKSVNDQHGHAAGDQALREVSECVAARIRSIDTLVRWGGEEFLVFMPATSKETAAGAAERLREAVEALEIPVAESILRCTISIGAATFGENGTRVETIIDAADAAVYEAKNGGRNRVVAAPNGDGESSAGMSIASGNP